MILDSWDSLMITFSPLIFVIVGLAISYTLYKIFSDNDLRIFLLINFIIQFIISIATENAVAVIVAILSVIPLVMKRNSEGSSENE